MELNSTFREEERRQGRSSKVSGDKKKVSFEAIYKRRRRRRQFLFWKGETSLVRPSFFQEGFFYRFPLHKKGETGWSGGEVVSSSFPPPLAQLWKGEVRKNGKPGQEEQEEEEDLWEPQPRRRRILYFLPSRLPPPSVRTGQNSSPGFPFQEEKKGCRQQRGKEAKRRCKQ